MELIRVGSTGNKVADVQRRLTSTGHPCDSDPAGEFADATLRSVREFQRARGLPADGIVGPDTWRALVEAGFHLGDRLLYETSPMLRGDDVRDLQRRLNRLGFDTGREDGIFGPDTLAAVDEFQANAGLKVDGIAGPESLRVLMSLHRQHQLAPAATVKEREALRRRQQRSLAGTRVLIDPGKGPDDPGAVGVADRPEHEVTWELATRLAGRLMARGVQTSLSRGPKTTPDASDRARLANLEEVHAVVSIQLNASDSDAACGAAGYYFGLDGFESEAGRHLAERAIDLIVEATGTANCRVHPSTEPIMRETRAPAVVIEPGFLSHPDEGKRLQHAPYQDAIAAALTDALVEFLAGG